MQVIIKVTRLNKHEYLPELKYATTGSSGVDLEADISEEVLLKRGQRCLVPTGIKLGLPHLVEGQIRPRSGIAMRHGVTVLNSPGTIDSDYRGEIQVLLINLGQEDYLITKGMRIAQIIFSSYKLVEFTYVKSLEKTPRNDGGFGSTGV